MSYAKLRGRIKEMYGTQAAFAKSLEMDPSSLSGKLTGKTEWTRIEIERACGLLGVPLAEAYLYFF